MKKYQLSVLIVVMLFSLCLNTTNPVQAEQVASATSRQSGSPKTDTYHAYLPVTVDDVGTPPSSIELIDQAVANGAISQETGLLYKVFATFSDPRLPSQYIGSGVGREGDDVIEEVVAQAQAGTLSQDAIDTLTPFFVPPDYPGSWYALQNTENAQASGQSPESNWSKLITDNHKVRILWLTTDGQAAAKAQTLKEAIDGKIWTMLTDLMEREPFPDSSGYLSIYLWHSYMESDGHIVPFDANTLGITIGSKCDRSATVIYLPSNLDPGDETHAGMIQYATHEMMHAIQFSYTIQNCVDYPWLKEATATWAEDYVYKDANSEWDTVLGYLKHTNERLDDMTIALHSYGAYLLPYYLTHQLGDDSIIRRIWEQAALEPNSYLAIKEVLPDWAQDVFWPEFLITLWNKAPYGQFYKDNDQMTYTVKPQRSQIISAAGGERTYPLTGDLPTGAARFYHFTVDPSVHSLTLLNGLGKDLYVGDADLNGDTTDGDQTYQFDDLSDSDAAGATLVGLMKVPGFDWQELPIGWGGNQLDSHSHCMDVQGPIDDLVIIQSNGDFDNPDRIMTPQGLPTRLVASDLPCWMLSGTASYTIYNAGVTKVFSAQNVVYSYPSAFPDYSQYPYVDAQFIYPSLTLNLLNAHVTWTVSGTDSQGCVYSGQGSFDVGEQPGAGSQTVTIFTGLLPSNPTYRGYEGQGSSLNGTSITYNVTGPGCVGQETEQDPFAFMEIPLTSDRANIKVPVGGGALSGSYQRDEPGGDYELMEWNLTPQTK